jgi:hypothetical protein
MSTPTLALYQTSATNKSNTILPFIVEKLNSTEYIFTLRAANYQVHHTQVAKGRAIIC